MLFSIIGIPKQKFEFLGRAISATAGRLVAVGASLLSSIVLARILGPDQYGLYSFGLTVGSLLALAVALGFPVLSIRETGRFLARGESALLMVFFGWMLRVVALSSVIVTALFMAILFYFPELGGARHQILLVSTPLAVLLTATSISGSVLLGLGRITLSMLPDQILRPLFVALIGTCIVLFGFIPDAQSMLILHSVSALISICFGVYLIFRKMPKERAGPMRDSQGEWLKALWPLAVIAGLQLMNQSVDFLVLGFIVSDADLGHYRIAQSVAQIALFGMTIGNMVVHAQASGLFARREKDALQKLLTSSSRTGFSLTMLILMIVVICGDSLICMLFGVDYLPAVKPLLILLAGSAIVSFFGAAGAALAMLGGEAKLLHGVFVGLSLKVLLGVPFSLLLGPLGMAIASAFSSIVASIVWFQGVKTCYDLRPAAFAIKWSR